MIVARLFPGQSCKQLHGTTKENNEHFCLCSRLSDESLSDGVLARPPLFLFLFFWFWKNSFISLSSPRRCRSLSPSAVGSQFADSHRFVVCFSLKIWSWPASSRTATWNFATSVSRGTSATARTYGRFWARPITLVSNPGIERRTKERMPSNGGLFTSITFEIFRCLSTTS